MDSAEALDFKYWGKACLGKIVSSIGKMIKVDQATSKRDKLKYARIMVEIQIDQSLPDRICFVNELDKTILVDGLYEWKPIVCTVCKGVGT